jgi:hypothetical protein
MALVSSTLHASPLRVHGSTTFQGLQVQAGAKLVRVVGSLRDESETAVAGVPVELTTTPPTPRIRGCDGNALVRTDLEGHFCFELMPGATSARLRFAGSEFLQPVLRDFALSEQIRPQLKLETADARWLLWQPEHEVRVELSGATVREHYQLRVLLERGPGTTALSVANMPLGSERAQTLTLSSDQLGAPGQATLTALLGDDAAHPLALARVPLLLVSKVDLRWEATPEPVRPELGFDLAVVVTSRGQPVNSGWIEAHANGRVVGSAPVHDGRAVVASRFLAAGDSQVAFEVRYVTDQPWLEPDSPLAWDLQIKRASGWTHLPWLLLGAGAGLWIFRGWWRPVRRADPITSRASSVREAGATLIHPGAPMSGHHGVVLDAHTGEVIANAQLRIVLPSVGAEVVAQNTVSDANGSFSLSTLSDLPEGARFEISAEHHSRLRLPPPKPGRLEIVMISRRRNLLQKLAEWARTRQWHSQRSLTPEEVAMRARERAESEVEHWALDVETAAFGRVPPDEQSERALMARAPALKGAPPLNR